MKAPQWYDKKPYRERTMSLGTKYTGCSRPLSGICPPAGIFFLALASPEVVPGQSNLGNSRLPGLLYFCLALFRPPRKNSLRPAAGMSGLSPPPFIARAQDPAAGRPEAIGGGSASAFASTPALQQRGAFFIPKRA